MNGTWGQVWLDGEEIGELVSFQTKDDYNKEDIKMAGKMSSGKKIIGVEGKGSMKFVKVNSRMIKKLGKLPRQGITPSFTVIAKIDDPDGLGSERAVFKGVVFDDLTLFDFEVESTGSTEHPFTYDDYEFLETV